MAMIRHYIITKHKNHSTSMPKLPGTFSSAGVIPCHSGTPALISEQCHVTSQKKLLLKLEELEFVKTSKFLTKKTPQITHQSGIKVSSSHGVTSQSGTKFTISLRGPASPVASVPSISPTVNDPFFGRKSEALSQGASIPRAWNW